MIKKNFAILLSFSILLCILLFSFYDIVKNDDRSKIALEKLKQECLKIDYEGTISEQLCKDVLSSNQPKKDFFSAYNNVLSNGLDKIGFVLILFLIIPALIPMSKFLKYKQVLNEGTRKNFNAIILTKFKQSYKSIVIFVGIIIASFTFCFVYTKTFDPSYSIINSSTVWSPFTMQHPFLFIVQYLLNIIIHASLFISISLCIVRKYHNYIISLILSFLAILGLEIFLEIIFNSIIFGIFIKSDMGIIFNIVNFLNFNDQYGMGSCMIVPFVLMLISFIVMNKMYKNKEKLIIDCEKNG